MTEKITLAEARDHLTCWKNADKAIATGQSYSMGDFSVTRADIEQVRIQIAHWSRIVTELEAAANGQRNPLVSFAKFT